MVKRSSSCRPLSKYAGVCYDEPDRPDRPAPQGRTAVVRVIVPPDPSGRVFEDDLDPGDLVFDRKLTPMLVWHERYPVGRGRRSGWVLSYDPTASETPTTTSSVSACRMSMPPWRRLASTCIRSGYPVTVGLDKRTCEECPSSPMGLIPGRPQRLTVIPG